MARKRPWRSGLTPIPVSPMPPSPARPSDGPGPGPHPPVPPILRGGGRSAAPRRPACNHAVAPYCRRRVRGPPGPMPGTGRTGPLERVHPGRPGPGLSKAAPTAPDERGGGVESPPHPALRPTTAERLPPRAFLPPDTARVWTAWDPPQGTTPRPRTLGRVGHECWDAETALTPDGGSPCTGRRPGLRVGAGSGHRQLAALEASPEFGPRRRRHRDLKPRLPGLAATPRTHRGASPSCPTRPASGRRRASASCPTGN